MPTPADATRELARFLRNRRERLAPAAAGLPERGRPRRTPGLRREEVAEIAGVSVDYVVRLEQGRGLHPSPDVLDALARALQLSTDERTYLHDLARHRPVDEPEPEPDAGAARLVHDLSPLPAMLLDHRFDLLAWNAEMVALMLDFGALAPARRNTVELCLLYPPLQTFYPDRERVIREAIADLRAAWAARPDDARLAAMIGDWTERSPEFRRLWQMHDVRVNGRGHKRFDHPEVGRLTMAFEVLRPLADPHQRLVIYRAADPATQRAMDRLSPSAPAVAEP